MAKDRFLVDVRPAGQSRSGPGQDGGGIAAYVILAAIIVLIVGTCL